MSLQFTRVLSSVCRLLRHIALRGSSSSVCFCELSAALRVIEDTFENLAGSLTNVTEALRGVCTNQLRSAFSSRNALREEDNAEPSLSVSTAPVYLEV